MFVWKILLSNVSVCTRVLWQNEGEQYIPNTLLYVHHWPAVFCCYQCYNDWRQFICYVPGLVGGVLTEHFDDDQWLSGTGWTSCRLVIVVCTAYLAQLDLYITTNTPTQFSGAVENRQLPSSHISL